MDVPPYISSGASSRAYYSLVRKVECANSSRAANQFLSDEVEAIRRHFADPGLSLVRNSLWETDLSKTDILCRRNVGNT